VFLRLGGSGDRSSSLFPFRTGQWVFIVERRHGMSENATDELSRVRKDSQDETYKDTRGSFASFMPCSSTVVRVI
jgi:hypothetical protein